MKIWNFTIHRGKDESPESAVRRESLPALDWEDAVFWLRMRMKKGEKAVIRSVEW